jgi:hypothetical protein
MKEVAEQSRAKITVRLLREPEKPRSGPGLLHLPNFFNYVLFLPFEI